MNKYKFPNPNLVATSYPAHLVSFHSMLTQASFSGTTLPVVLGKLGNGQPFVADLAEMPHLLIAGATGQGKSVGINTLLLSLLFRCHPDMLKLVLIDPKRVELSIYKKLADTFLAPVSGLKRPVITDIHEAMYVLNSLCIEMDERYMLLETTGCRNISQYNTKYRTGLIDALYGHHFLPHIVLVIDEFADFILTAGKEIEIPVIRLAQLGRASGIHLVIATQRPTANVITGLIKANIPARLAYRVASKLDSRIILDDAGAEQLTGKGDMLYKCNLEKERLQGAFVDVPEIERVLDFISNQDFKVDHFRLPEYEEI